MSGAIPPLPQYASWRGALLKHRDNFTFTFNCSKEQLLQQCKEYSILVYLFIKTDCSNNRGISLLLTIYKHQPRPPVRVDAPQKAIPKFSSKLKYGHESQLGARGQNGLTDWLIVSNNMTWPDLTWININSEHSTADMLFRWEIGNDKLKQT
jgi:hypothetical protein